MRLRRSSKRSSEQPKGGEPKPAPAKRRPTIAETFRVAWAPPRLRGPSVRASGVSAGAPAGTAAAPSVKGKQGTGRRAAAVGQPVQEPDLLRQREELARQFAELQWDLGGIAYEMATRKQFKGEVILKQAEKLREVDAKLGQIERVLRLGEEGAAGTCPNCGALQARGAVFCWRCGKQVSTGAPEAGEKKTSGDAGAKPSGDGKGKPNEAAKPESK